jgi:hypothetical protein
VTNFEQDYGTVQDSDPRWQEDSIHLLGIFPWPKW